VLFTQTQGMEERKKVHPADIPFRAKMLFRSLFLTNVSSVCRNVKIFMLSFQSVIRFIWTY